MTINLDTLTLGSGKHTTPKQGMCLIEAAAYMAGEPFSDHPRCVSPLLANVGRQLNDLLPTAQRQTLKPLIPHLVGTESDGLDQQRSEMAWSWIVTVYTPTWLRLAGLNDQAAALETADANDALPLLVAARYAANDAARAAANDAAWDATRAAAWDAAWDATQDAAWDVANDAARAAARAAARDVARDAAWDATRVAAWDATRVAAGVATRVAARDALQPTSDTLRASFTEKYRAMVMLGTGTS